MTHAACLIPTRMAVRIVALLSFLTVLSLPLMDSSAGPYEPFPVSGDSSQIPPPALDPSHPFTGVEIIVSGLPLDSLSEAPAHLTSLIDKLRSKGNVIPPYRLPPQRTFSPLISYMSHLRDRYENLPDPTFWRKYARSWTYWMASMSGGR